VTRWHPNIELARVLEALSEDIIAASDGEVREMHGRALASTSRGVKLVIKAARADEGSRAMVGPDTGPGSLSAGSKRLPPHQQRH